MLGHLIYNYAHLDDCRIQQEISKTLYTKAFNGVHLVHAYNGDSSFGYQPYLEDKLVKIKNHGHFQGACDLINAGLSFFQTRRIQGLRYVLVTAADTWMIDVPFLKKLVHEMEQRGQVLATSSWGAAKAPEKMTGFSTDFFVIDLAWNRNARLFPLDYPAFKRQFADLFYLQYSQPVLEAAVQYRFQKYFADHFEDNEIWRERNKAHHRIVEREPVHVAGERIPSWPKIGLYTSPDPHEKQRALKKIKVPLGPYAKKLLSGSLIKTYNKTAR